MVKKIQNINDEKRKSSFSEKPKEDEEEENKSTFDKIVRK